MSIVKEMMYSGVPLPVSPNGSK